MLEIHVHFQKNVWTRCQSTLEFEELKEMTAYLREFKEIRENTVDKNSPNIANEEMKKIFGRSVVASRDILKGAYCLKKIYASKTRNWYSNG